MSVTDDGAAGNAQIAPGPLLDELEAATLCRLSRTTFRRLRTAGLIAPVVLPLGLKRNLYARRDVERFAEEIASGDHAVA
jgi:hypothetical protein